jgi:hypothetical protein
MAEKSNHLPKITQQKALNNIIIFLVKTCIFNLQSDDTMCLHGFEIDVKQKNMEI